MILPETVIQDLRYGLRMLSRNLGFTTVAVFALAIGIGVNTAVFTAYKAMIARPIDARKPSEMVNVALVRQSGAADFRFSYADYEAYRESLHSFRGLIAFREEHMTLSAAGAVVSQRSSEAGSLLRTLGLLPSGASNAEFAAVYAVSENYFQVLGVPALRGRTFDSTSVSELAASHPVLISENYWRRRFTADPNVLGKSVRLNNVTVQVIGIAPHDFAGTGIAVPDFWVPLGLEPLLHADANWLRDRENQCCRMFGRLAPSVGIGQAQAETNIVAARLRTLHDARSDWAKPASVLVWPGSPFPLPLRFFRGLQMAILLVMLAAAMLLVVACGNVCSLQLARARSRQTELQTRLSLGANRLRIIRQLLTESALLALVAGIVALLLAWSFSQLLLHLYSESVPAEYAALGLHVAPDLEIFAYVLAISLIAAILFGFAPAAETSRAALASTSRSSTLPRRTRRLQDLLIAAQVSLSLVLVIAGSVLIRGSIRSIRADTGYDSKQTIDLDVQFPEASKYTPELKLAIINNLRARLAALPGVAAVTSARPPDDFGFRTAAVALSAAKTPVRSAESILYYTYVQANYFRTLSIPLLLGRGFPAHEQAGHSVILSESAARQLWPGQNPVGHTLRLGATDERVRNTRELSADGPSYQVIAVARDTRGVEFDGSDSKQIYLPLPDDRLPSHPILIRTESNPGQVLRAVDPLISSLDPALVVTSSTVEEMLRRSAPFLASSLAAAIASSVGSLGLFLALMGIYGTVSYIVVLRTREVGIRMAIGAQRRDVLALILRESTRSVLAGLLAGIMIAFLGSYLLRGLLYGLSGVDSISFLAVPLLFLAIALLAAYAPSRRAMRVDPMVALRYE